MQRPGSRESDLCIFMRYFDGVCRGDVDYLTGTIAVNALGLSLAEGEISTLSISSGQRLVLEDRLRREPDGLDHLFFQTE